MLQYFATGILYCNLFLTCCKLCAYCEKKSAFFLRLNISFPDHSFLISKSFWNFLIWFFLFRTRRLGTKRCRIFSKKQSLLSYRIMIKELLAEPLRLSINWTHFHHYRYFYIKKPHSVFKDKLMQIFLSIDKNKNPKVSHYIPC